VATETAAPAIPAIEGSAPQLARTRLASLDVFRGATIASMMLVNNPGDGEHVYTPLEHAAWHGWTFTDTVFPFFLWIAGLAMTLSTARRVDRGEDRGKLLLHILRRAAMIFVIGLLLNGFPYYNPSRIRIPGVLQRIAVCYLVAGMIFLYTRVRGQIIAIAILLGVYAFLMNGNFNMEANYARWVDGRLLAGHMWSHTRYWDPEGVVSTLPAIATTLFGILAGHILRMRASTPERATWLFLAGNLLLAAGLVWSNFMPINKNLWTASFSVFMAGMATIVFAMWYWIVDVQGWTRITRPLAIYGMNAIAVFILSGLIGRLLGIFKLQGPIYSTMFAPIADPYVASVAYALAFVLMLYAVAYIMYRRGWFLKV
jgi:predicted acyltransferase